MRSLATFEEEKIALRFWNYLQSEGIKSTLEEEGPRDWVIWVIDEEKIPSATQSLEKFNLNPDDPAFSTTKKVSSKRKEEKKENTNNKSRFKNHNLKEKWSTQSRRPGMICLSLIIVSIIFYLFCRTNPEGMYTLFISEGKNSSLSEVKNGEIWRLISPIFIHYNFIHIFMNMYILSLFGSQIEKRKGSLFLVLFVLVTAILSNLAEYNITGNNKFGGMSGVNYGLFGYIWIKSIFDPGDGLYIDQMNVVILMAWFFICFAVGDFEGIGFANWVHAGGLATGSAWAYISARKWTRR